MRFRLLGEPVLVVTYSITAAPSNYSAVIPSSAYYCLDCYSFIARDCSAGFQPYLVLSHCLVPEWYFDIHCKDSESSWTGACSNLGPFVRIYSLALI